MKASSEDDDEICCTSAHNICSNEDILSKILAGLPLISLRRCKSVCKRWSSLITDPFFMSLRSRSPNADHPRGLFLQLLQASSELTYLPLTKASSSRLRTTRFPFYAPDIQLLQSCNGLLLCYDVCSDKLYVYNPTINHCKLLPLPQFWNPDSIFLTSPALAFDPAISPQYKLVYPRIGSPHSLEIYSSETGDWSTCAPIYDKVTFGMFDWRVVYWRDAIHWLSRLHIYHLSLHDIIHNPHFIQTQNNNLQGVIYGLDDRLFVSTRDCLLLVKMILPPLQMNVYAMNDYSSGWSVKYHVNLEAVLHFPRSNKFKVISVVLREKDDDSFLVLEVTGIALIQYNIISNTFHQLCDLTQIRSLYCSFFFTPCLVGL